MDKESVELICIECESKKNVKTANGIPICARCIYESEKKYKEFEKYRNLSPNISEIIEGKLYLGNDDQAQFKDDLLKYKITHILVCGSELDKHFPKDFTYEHFKIEDLTEQDLKPYFKKAINFIENGACVYVHCRAGVSRSPSFVIAYIMFKNKIGFEEAFQLVKKKRNQINPNQGFQSNLRELEVILKNEKQF